MVYTLSHDQYIIKQSMVNISAFIHMGLNYSFGIGSQCHKKKMVVGQIVHNDTKTIRDTIFYQIKQSGEKYTVMMKVIQF